MAQALARLRFDDFVTTDDVDESLRLIEASKASLYESVDYDADTTSASKIYKIIRDLTNADAEEFQSEWSMRAIRDRVLAHAFTEDQLTDCVKEYEDLGVLMLIENGSKLVFIDAMDLEMQE